MFVVDNHAFPWWGWGYPIKGNITKEQVMRWWHKSLSVGLTSLVTFNFQLHRTCFKCRRCDAQLSVVNFYETENGEYCCDMCPDEEKNHVEVTTANKRIVEDW